MAAAKTMVLAGFGFALNCVAVGNFAFCHGCEATIIAISIQQLAVSRTFSPQRDVKENQNSEEVLLFLRVRGVLCGKRFG
jgi:hypothetical protein